MDTRKFNRALEVWRRSAHANVATKDISDALINALADQGFEVVETATRLQDAIELLLANNYTVTPSGGA